MELSVLVQRNPGNGYRAWCDTPLRAEAEGATREEALAKLRAVLEISTREVEVVRLSIPIESQLADPPGTLGDEQADDPEAVTRWINEFNSIPPVQMTAAEEAEWQISRSTRGQMDSASIEALAASLAEDRG